MSALCLRGWLAAVMHGRRRVRSTLIENEGIPRGSHVVVHCHILRKFRDGNGNGYHLHPRFRVALEELTHLFFDRANVGRRWGGLVVGIIISAVFLPLVVTVYAITGF